MFTVESVAGRHMLVGSTEVHAVKGRNCRAPATVCGSTGCSPATAGYTLVETSLDAYDLQVRAGAANTP